MTAQPELQFDARPRLLVSDSPQEFEGIIARADGGEIIIESIAVGDGNAQWLFGVRWLK